MHAMKILTTPNGPVMVEKTKMMGGDWYTFSAWEPGDLFGVHGTLTHAEGRCWGQIGTRATPGIEKLTAGSPERIALVVASGKAQRAEAHAYILAAFPEAAAGKPGTGSLGFRIELGR